MKIINVTGRFKDNCIRNKRRFRRLWHWTGGVTANGAINWLDSRFGGKGTVGYNYIIDKNGIIYMLANPNYEYMQSSGLGREYDKNTIAISIVMKDETEDFTEQQIIASKELIDHLNERYEIFEDTHHAFVNSHKRDFPNDMWVHFKNRVGL